MIHLPSFKLHVLLTAGAVGLSAGFAGADDLPDLSGQSFAFGGFGGDLQANQEAAWLVPFEEATGVTINQTDSPDLATIMTQQEAGNVVIDVVQIESSTVDANCGDVFLEASIDRSELNPAYDSNACGVPVVKFSFVLAYNSASFEAAPTSVGDFFDTENYPGVRAAGGNPNHGLVEAALLYDGVSRDAMYPIDLERALSVIETRSGDVTIVSSFALMQDGIANGEYDMALIPNGRALNASLVNPDVRVVFDGAITLYDNLAIPQGAKNVEAATAFLDYVARHSTQVALAERFPYGVGTTGPAPLMDDQASAFFPDSFADVLLVQDADWWGENLSEVSDRLLGIFAQ